MMKHKAVFTKRRISQCGTRECKPKYVSMQVLGFSWLLLAGCATHQGGEQAQTTPQRPEMNIWFSEYQQRQSVLFRRQETPRANVILEQTELP